MKENKLLPKHRRVQKQKSKSSHPVTNSVISSKSTTCEGSSKLTTCEGSSKSTTCEGNLNVTDSVTAISMPSASAIDKFLV